MTNHFRPHKMCCVCVIYCCACFPRQTINFMGCPAIDRTAFWQLAKGLRRIRFLNASGCPRITSDGLIPFAASAKRLSVLDLDGCMAVDDSVLEALAEHCKDLKSLNIRGCVRITDRGVFAIADNCKLLHKLNMSNIPHTSARCIKKLALQCKYLQTLDVSGADQIPGTFSRQPWDFDPRTGTYISLVALTIVWMRFVTAEKVITAAAAVLRYAEPADSYFGLRPHPNRRLLYMEVRTSLTSEGTTLLHAHCCGARLLSYDARAEAGVA